ncbi:hypothetical protein NPIL_207061 [Nephila pilipes]|uniref:Uncharacterized protein n=1 Tax=Nephila pilipes TaxID=299642 RepID=A0A8X6IQS9_NEPPI|nr:hypothetical protein NPIL_207061 [Nephila pilipes]
MLPEEATQRLKATDTFILSFNQVKMEICNTTSKKPGLFLSQNFLHSSNMEVDESSWQPTERLWWASAQFQKGSFSDIRQSHDLKPERERPYSAVMV